MMVLWASRARGPLVLFLGLGNGGRVNCSIVERLGYRSTPLFASRKAGCGFALVQLTVSLS